MKTNERTAAANISEDDLWFLANYEVRLEREGWSNISDEYVKHTDYIAQIRAAIRDDAELEYQYGDIEESAFENYDIDNG